MIQLSPKRLFAGSTLAACGIGMFLFLSRVAYMKSATRTLGNWVGIAAELGFVLWIGTAICMGAATAIALKRRRLGALVGFVVWVAVALWFQSPIEK